jgi:hypothetical protein
MPATFQPAPFQTAFVVEDIHAAMQAYGAALGAGPWFLRERGVFAEQTYRGAPAATMLSIAMAAAGETIVELIRQHDDGPSVYRDVVAARGYGLHHFGVGVEDYAAGCAAQGGRMVYQATVAHGARVGYFETPGLPFMIEVVEMLPASRAMFARMRDAHRAWDGSFHVGPLGAPPPAG